MSSFAREIGAFDLAQEAKVSVRDRLDDGDIFHAVSDQSSKFLGRGLSASGPIHCSGTTLDIPATKMRRTQHVPYQRPKSVLSNFSKHPVAFFVLKGESHGPRFTPFNLSAFTYFNRPRHFG